MPNWCKGDLKVRGKKENIKKFLLEALNPVTWLGDEAPKPQIDDEDPWEFNVTSKSDFHVKGTRRNFVEAGCIQFYPPEEDEICVLVLEDYKAAWGIDADALRDLSEEFSLDFKILGFEQGQEFNQDIEIIQGKIIKNNEITFDDYKWECIRPHVGG